MWGEKGPAFGSAEEATHILGLVYRFYDSTRRVLAEMPQEFRPMLKKKEGEMAIGEMRISPQEWCLGFCLGLHLQNPKWKVEFMDDERSFLLLSPIIAFVLPQEMEEYLGPQPAVTHDEFLAALFDFIPKLYEYWRPRRRDWPAPATSGDSLLPQWAKASGNAPCPCGSGKKCRECCGAPPN
jgi:yecA family protein